MSVRIRFDSTGNVENPTFVLATRNGTKLGNVPYYGLTFRDTLNSGSEMSFKVNKNGFTLWDQLKDFKLIWVRDFDLWFEIYVELDENDETAKNVIAKSLGEAELSQINVYELECNTESEIEKEGYTPTVFFNEEKQEDSLLHRIMHFAPHYRIKHVDSSIGGIKRVFSFNGVSVYDAFQQIAKEMNCLFVIGSGSDEYGNIDRFVSVHDLESYCIDCGHREEFSGSCPECGSTNILVGYGEFTTIYIDSENLADNITFSTDTGAVKNCFRLEAGDDLMTETIGACNPNGSPYIWYISDELKADMSDDLVKQLEAYDSKYAYYYNDHVTDLSGETLTGYNDLITKYLPYNGDLKEQAATITGYSNLVRSFSVTADFYNFLESDLMSEYEVRTAAEQAASLNNQTVSPIAINNATNINKDMADNAVLAIAKTIVDPDFTVKILDSLLDDDYTVSFQVSNADGTDVAISKTITVNIVDDFQTLIEQKIQKVIAGYRDDIPDIMQLFNYGAEDFVIRLKNYCLTGLTVIEDAVQSVIDTLIEEGISDKNKWKDNDPDLYQSIYVQYYKKLYFAKAEIKVRKSEVATIASLQNDISNQIIEIQDVLNFEKFIGEKLWLDFVAYRREQIYSNTSYTSDGLTYSELYNSASEFIEVAKKDIYKSATLQHSISATLKNLLTMKEFEPIVNYFAVGNWIQVRVDGVLYRLRLLDYEIDFDNLQNIAITFSNVKNVSTGATDLESILSSAEAMATTYNNVQRQAKQGENSQNTLRDWTKNGLYATNTKIVGGADNQTQTWDHHGMLFRKYDSISDSYDDIQLKIINSTISITDDNWQTVKTAIGAYYYFHPETGKLTRAYGVNAEVLIGNLILGENLGIYNESGSMSFDNDGFLVTNGTNSFRVNPNSEILMAISNGDKDVFYIDVNGVLHISADGTGMDISANSDITDMKSQVIQNKESITTEVKRATETEKGLSESYSKLEQKVDSFTLTVNNGDTSSTIKLMAGETEISSQEIKLTGMVTFDDLQGDGTTVINGSNISTGKISAIDIEGCTISGGTFESLDEENYGLRIDGGLLNFLHAGLHAGCIYMNESGTFSITTSAGYEMYINSDSKLWLRSDGEMKIDSMGGVIIGSDTNTAKVEIGSDGKDVCLKGNVYIMDGDTKLSLADYITQVANS